MNTKFKIAVATVALCGGFSVCQAQQSSTVSFTYDRNGNRTAQNYIPSGSKGMETGNDNHLTDSAALDVLNSLKISLYPNPTSDNLTLSVQDKPAELNLLLKITTVSGSVIQEKLLSSDQETFDMSGLPAGVYLFQLISGDKGFVWKVMKQ